jgi:hypothetical protein
MASKKTYHRKSRPARGIPFIALVPSPGWERNARMALENPRTPPELRAQIERYLDNPIREALKDQAARERVFNELLDDAERKEQRRVKAGTENLRRQNADLKDEADTRVVDAFNRWCAGRSAVLADLTAAEKLRKYRVVAKPSQRDSRRLGALLKAGRLDEKVCTGESRPPKNRP